MRTDPARYLQDWGRFPRDPRTARKFAARQAPEQIEGIAPDAPRIDYYSARESLTNRFADPAFREAIANTARIPIMDDVDG